MFSKKTSKSTTKESYYKDFPLQVEDKDYRIRIEICPKIHSSGVIANDEVTLRISNLLSLQDREDHIDALLNKIAKKIKKHPPPFDPLSELFTSPFLKKQLDEKDIFLTQLSLNNDCQYDVYFRKAKTGNKYKAKLLPHKRIVIELPDFRMSKEKKEKIRRLVYRIIGDDQLPFIYDFLTFLNLNHFREKIKDIKLKYTRSRWGSCSKQRNINLSVKLFFVPIELMEYVCVHELAHLKEMNHSRHFWKLVEKVMPDYKEKRKMLKKYGG